MRPKLQLLAFVVVCVFSSRVAFAAPSITSLSPTSGAVGASITITGTNFGSPQGSSTVKFNATTATTITSWTTTSIVAKVPADSLYLAGLVPGLLLVVLVALYGIHVGRKVKSRRRTAA